MSARLIGAVVLGALAGTAAGADILDAHYDAARDQIVAEIAYRGTNADHEFVVEWGRCSAESPPRLAGRLIDRQGKDAAREDYRVSEEIPLRDMPCRPALVTLRLGRSAHADLFVEEK